MGLFSFFKNAGSNKLKEAEAKAKAEALDAMETRERLLEDVIESSGIAVTNLNLELEAEKITVFGQTASQSDREKIILMLGNMDGIAAIDDRLSVLVTESAPVEPESQFYTVQSGDSLSKIAKQFYGDPMKYNLIFEANQPMLTDPNKIYPGQNLRIPTI